ncbi:MAG: hypothetical protein EBU89_03825 [Actinobacteria bacterium]|nr:hypothetical protein [Actinomycetota bacterium]NBO35049.1 hypothetical protein [Actinomycetota bacterium]
MVFPFGVTMIASFAFHNTAALTSITLPASVTSIRDYAFNNASALTAFNVDSDNPSFA